MGNQIQKNDYDMVFQIEKLLDVDLGFAIKIQNQQLKEWYQPEKGEESKMDSLKKNISWDSQIVSILGQKECGKTFLLNLLGGLELPNQTNGLSMKKVLINDQNFLFLDSKGIHQPILPLLPFKENKMQIEETKATEMFLRDLSISSSHLHLLVVDQSFSPSFDHSLLLNISKSIALKLRNEALLKKSLKKKNKNNLQNANNLNKFLFKTKPEFLVIHNMKELDYEKAILKWKKYVCEMKRYHSFHQSNTPNLSNNENNNYSQDENFLFDVNCITPNTPSNSFIFENLNSIFSNHNNFYLNNNFFNKNEKLKEGEKNDVTLDINEESQKDEKIVEIGENFVEKIEVKDIVDGEEITITHILLSKHVGVGINHNLHAIEEIKKWLSSEGKIREFKMNPLAYFSSLCEMNISNYLTGTNKMGMYYLSDPFSLFYQQLHSSSLSPNNKVTEDKLIRENCEKFHLELEKNNDFSQTLSLLETKNILKWSVSQCEQLREWMLTGKDRKVNGVSFEFFPRLYNLDWEDFAEGIWKRNIDYIILYAISQVLKYRIVIVTSSLVNPIFVFAPEKEKWPKETLYFSFVRYDDSECFYARLIPKEQLLAKKIEKNEREIKIRKFSHVEQLTFRSNENSKEKKIFGKSILKSEFVSSNLSSNLDFSQQFSVKYTTEINKKDDSLRIVVEVPDSSNDQLEYQCNLLQDPKRFKLEVKGRREQEEDWIVSEGTRKFGDWTFNYEIPKQYTLDQPDVVYNDGVLIFTFKFGEAQSIGKKIIRLKKQN